MCGRSFSFPSTLRLAFDVRDSLPKESRTRRTQRELSDSATCGKASIQSVFACTIALRSKKQNNKLTQSSLKYRAVLRRISVNIFYTRVHVTGVPRKELRRA